jgi:hypothetical protein
MGFDPTAEQEMTTLRDEARGLPYDPDDDCFAILALELGCSSTRH